MNVPRPPHSGSPDEWAWRDPAADGLVNLRRSWPVSVSWQAVRETDPKAFRDAAIGSVMLPCGGLFALIWTGLTYELPFAIQLPEGFEWAAGPLAVVLFWTAALLGVFGVLMCMRPSEVRRELAFRAFAEAQGLSYSRYGHEPASRGIFFAESGDAVSARNRGGPSRFKAQHSLEHGRTDDEPDLQIAVAGYAGQKGDPSAPRAAFRFLQLRLPRRLPHLMIDARANGGLRHLLPGGQRITLEGDFDRHFTTYAPEGYARDALELLTPDVMAALIDFGRKWDIEVVENRMIVVSNRFGRRWDRLDTTALLRFAEIVGAELVHQAMTYSDPRAELPRVQVAAPGRRLRRRSRAWTTAIVGGCVFAALAYPFLLDWLLDLN